MSEGVGSSERDEFERSTASAMPEAEARKGYKWVQLGPKSIEVPEEWKHVYFDDVITLNPSCELPSGGPVDFLPMDAVNENDRSIDYWTQREPEDCTTTKFKNGDTVYGKITPCAENGKIAQIEELSTNVGSGSTEFLVFRGKENRLSSDFVFYLVNFSVFRDVTISLMEGSTGRQRIPTDIFKSNLEIPFPSLPEQRRITEVLSTVDEQIRQTQAVIEATKELRRGLMQNVLHHGIGHEEFKEMHIGPKRSTIPTNWDIVQLEEIAELQSGSTPKRSNEEYWKDGSIPWVKSGEFNDKVIETANETITEKALENTGCVIFPEGTLLLALYGKGTVSKTARLGLSAATNQAIAGILPKSGSFDPRYLQYYLIHSRNTLLNVTVNPSSDTGRTNIYLSALRSFKVALPPIEEQKRIAERLSIVDHKIAQEQETKEDLQELKRGLMQDLLTGTVRVPESIEAED
jgi:type I restriction enzyme S subunit